MSQEIKVSADLYWRLRRLKRKPRWLILNEQESEFGNYSYIIRIPNKYYQMMNTEISTDTEVAIKYLLNS